MNGRKREKYHHGNLRSALIDAALELVSSEGAKRLSLRAVARRAGVSTAAPYRHFASRNALLAAVAEEGFRTLSAEIRGRASRASDPLARLRESGVAYVLFATANPAHYRVMFNPEAVEAGDEPSYREAAAESLGLLLEAIQDCQAANVVRDDDPFRLALVAWSGMHGLASLVATRQVTVLGLGDPGVEEMARYVATALLEGVMAGPV